MKSRILVVDDELIVHETIKDILGSKIYEFRMCFDKSEAELQVQRENFDLAIIDLKLSEKLGDISGFELLKKLKNIKPKMPVIVMTQYNMDPDMIVECMRNGAYYYFIKKKFISGQKEFNLLVDEAINYVPERDLIEDMYPHPIALLYRDCKRNVIAPRRKFERLIELLEVTLKFVGIICLADLVQTKIDDDKVSNFVKTKMNRPSFGHWNELTRIVDSPTNKQSCFWIPKILKTFNPKLRKSIDDLIQIRNENIGHGASKPEHEYSELVEKCEQTISSLLQGSTILGTWELFLVKSSKKVSDSEYQHSIINLNGHNPRFLSIEKKMSHDLIVDRVYAFDPDHNQILSLHPLIIVAICPRCIQEAIFIYDKFDRDVIHYLDYVNGHHNKSIEFYREMINFIPAS